MKKLFLFFLILLTLSCFLGCEKKNVGTIISTNIYYASVLRREGTEVSFLIPLITDFEVDEISEIQIGFPEVDSFEWQYYLIEEYQGYFSYYLDFAISTNMYDDFPSQAITISSLILLIEGEEYPYSFGQIQILPEYCQNDLGDITILGQGIYYPDFHFVNLDLSMNRQITITDISASNGFSITNADSYLNSYADGSSVNLTLALQDSAYEINKAYEFDIVVTYLSDSSLKSLSGFSTFRSQIDLINRQFIDSMEG